ncbi:MAG TPA: ATP-dependent zinc metalloprotease FtsH [Rectinemataceae bacterium]|nr:ATP-dependent zinc metalloprotease FtsH [Rectinemataceae bacterium]
MDMNDGDENMMQARDAKDQEEPGLKKHEPFFKPLDKKQIKFSLWYFLLMLMGLFTVNMLLRPNVEWIDYSDFKAKVGSGEITRVEMSDKYLIGFSMTKAQLDSIGKTHGDGQKPAAEPKIFRAVRMADRELLPLMDKKGAEYFAVADSSWLGSLVSWVLPIVAMVFFWTFLSKRVGSLGQGVMSFGANRAKLVAEGDTGVTFQDVAGVDEAKTELVEVVDFLKDPKKYEAIGGTIPKGVLLVGPPGTGKTLLARAVAGEAKVPFFKISGAEFVEMFVGVGAARVRDLFKQAREKAPCLVFIDELDAIGKSRGFTLGGNDEREQTLNQLLVEMDGFDSRTGVIILAATNRPEILDPALLRPGRFDRQVLVDKPDLKGRVDILKIHSQKVKLDASVDLQKVARGTPGFTGADLANIVNEAALLAVRAGRQRVLPADFDAAIERVIAGLEKKNRLLNEKERTIVAYHETGHALVASQTRGADPVHKISIIPRGIGALGYTIQLPTEERFLLTKEELLGKIDVLLGGRASEEVFFGEISTGASNDITRSTDIARKMVSDYGMSDKFQNVVLPSQRSSMFLPGETMPGQREYSESTQQYIDEEITRVIKGRYDHVKKVLESKKGVVEKIAKRLLEVETLEEAEFQALLDGHGCPPPLPKHGPAQPSVSVVR